MILGRIIDDLVVNDIEFTMEFTNPQWEIHVDKESDDFPEIVIGNYPSDVTGNIEVFININGAMVWTTPGSTKVIYVLLPILTVARKLHERGDV